MNRGIVNRIGPGRQQLHTSFLPSESADKLISFPDQGCVLFATSAWKHVMLAKRSSNSRAHFKSAKQMQIKALKALRQDANGLSMTSTNEASSPISTVMDENFRLEAEAERSLEALLQLQKSMLEKQWYLNLDQTNFREFDFLKSFRRTEVVRSGKTSARQRRQNARRMSSTEKPEVITQIGNLSSQEHLNMQVGSLGDFIPNSVDDMLNQKLLTHEEVIHLSEKIQNGIALRKHKSRLKTKLGYEPSITQWAASMGIPVMVLDKMLIESSFAAEKLTACNTRLVVSIAQKYRRRGVDISELIEGGIHGLRHGIEKFDSSKGFKLSTYVYWWIRLGITRALADQRVIRIPNHMRERLALIRKAKQTLQQKRVKLSLKNIAATLNMSEEKVKTARQAGKKIISFDKKNSKYRNGTGQTFHSTFADPASEKDPWLMVENVLLKENLRKLIDSTLTNREKTIIRLYFGIDTHSHTWEAVGKRLGLSRERVRQIGRLSVEKLKQATIHHKLQPRHLPRVDANDQQ